LRAIEYSNLELAS